MCVFERFCCCFSLKTGMQFICVCYLLHFVLLIWDSEYFRDILRSIDSHLFPFYIHGGIAVTIFALFGIVGDKRVFFVYPLIMYEILLLIYRIALIVRFYETHSSADKPPLNISYLVIQIYVIMIEFSFVHEPLPPVIAFSPLSQQTNTIVINQPISIAPSQISTVSYPVEYYSQQQPYFYPAVSQSYPAFQHQTYPPTNTGNISQNQQTTNEPFPYDAPPPYSEALKKSALESQ